MAKLVLTTPWTSQPQINVGIDKGNPLTKGLYVAANFTSLRPINSVSGKQSTGSTTQPTMQGGPMGRGAFFANASTIYTDVLGSLGNRAGGSISIAIGFRQTTTAGVGPRLIDNTDTDNTAPTLQFSSGTTWQFGAKSDATGGTVSIAGGAAVNTDQHFLLTIDGSIANLNSGRIKWYVNGEAKTVTVVANGDGNIVDTNTRVGGIQAAPRSADCRIYYFYKFNRVLSPQEAKALAENPWQVFSPLQRTFFIVAAAGGSLIKSINGLAIASVKSLNGLAIASVKSIDGLSNV